MCVNRHLYVYSSKDIDTTSNLYVKGNVYKWVKGTGKTYNWQQVVGEGGTSEDVFLAQCGSTPPFQLIISTGQMTLLQKLMS